MRPLRVRQQAKAEILKAYDRYFQNSPAAAQRFVDAVDEAIARIEERPELFPVIRAACGACCYGDFPTQSISNSIRRASAWSA